MDLSWSKEQIALKKDVIEFARAELNKNVVENDENSQFPVEKWPKCAQFRIQGLCIPPEYGGQGQDVLTAILIMEGLGYGCEDNGLTWALNGQMRSVQEPLVSFGSKAQKQRYLPGLCRGQLIGRHGMTESGSGSDAYSLRTRVDKQNGGYILNGSKIMISLAPVCDLAVVFATTDLKLG